MINIFKFTNSKWEIGKYTWLCSACEKKAHLDGIELVEQLSRIFGYCNCCHKNRVLVSKWEIKDSYDFNFNF